MRYIEVDCLGQFSCRLVIDLVNGFQACNISLHGRKKGGPSSQMRLKVLRAAQSFKGNAIASGHASLTKEVFEQLLKHVRKTIYPDHTEGDQN